MNESILKALMQLFALVVNVDEEGLSPEARSIIEEYLRLHLSQDLVEEYLNLFDYYLKTYRTSSKDHRKIKKRIASKSVKVLTIGEEINSQLQQKEKIIVILRLLELISISGITPEELDFVDTISDLFNIDRNEYENIKTLVLKSSEKIKDKKNLLIVNNRKKLIGEYEYKHIFEPNLNGEIKFLYLPVSNLIILKYTGIDALFLNGFLAVPNHCYIFDEGSVLKNPRISPIYYSDIIARFIHSIQKDKIWFCAENISFKFPNSENGIHNFSIYEKSGRLIGIMGASGAGKSTLLNLLIGQLPLRTGKITINGYDIHKDKDRLQGIVGYVPQDDLLIEELTVFENLYFSAKLLFRGYNKYQILSRVVRVLKDLDLYDIKDLKVGNPLNKFISGGQRKRLNIALELIREPAILFVDEPTSGLSSADSEMVMSLLKELTLKGKLVFVNIHQPSSDIFKLFDRIIILDKGGYPVYYGNPIAGISYFRRLSNIANPEAVICPTCGNIKPDEILELIEAKVINEYGKLTAKRKFSPKFWYQQYKKNIEPKQEKDCPAKQTKLPKVFFKIESTFNQFKVFSIRNLLSKLANKQYVIINLLEAPVLALILAYFSKYISGTPADPNAYVFAENVNIPAFLFMSVVVALFIGLTVSAEEIIRDRRILKKEAFLNLSYKAYVNSKVFYLMILSAFQMLVYVAVYQAVLGIKGMFFQHWLILFLTAFWANLLGLNISAMLNSVITIYITIPLILIPQLLFSGTVIEFSKLHKNFANEKYVPVIGDVMTSRWAYEALMVTQFKDNPYEKNFFDYDLNYYNAIYYATIYYDQLEKIISYIEAHHNDTSERDILFRKVRIFKNEIPEIEAVANQKFPYAVWLDTLETFNKAKKDKILEFLYQNIKQPNIKRQNMFRVKKDSVYYSLIEKLGSEEAVRELKNSCHNKRVEAYVTNKVFDIVRIKEGTNELIRSYYPIFQLPDNHYGRAQFFAPYKFLGSWKIDTFWFNALFILLFSILLYLILLFRILQPERLVKSLETDN